MCQQTSAIHNGDDSLLKYISARFPTDVWRGTGLRVITVGKRAIPVSKYSQTLTSKAISSSKKNLFISFLQRLSSPPPPHPNDLLSDSFSRLQSILVGPEGGKGRPARSDSLWNYPAIISLCSNSGGHGRLWVPYCVLETRIGGVAK